MKYTIKQAVLSSLMVAEVNSTDRHPEYYDDYLSVVSKPTQALIDKARYLYQTVGYIDADDLNGVFHKGNVWDGFDSDIEHVGVGMHSISIGDIIINDDGEAVVVDGSGFTSIAFDNSGISNYK
jgi:hypothetical protein